MIQLATEEEKQSLAPAWETASFAPQALSKAGVVQEPKFDLNQVSHVSCQCVTIPAKAVIVKVVAANVVPPSYAPDVENNEQLQQFSQWTPEQNITCECAPSGISPLSPEKEQLFFSKIDLSSMQDWSDDLQTKIQTLFKEYSHIFPLESLAMGHTLVVKHKIKLDNYTPFKERYRCIPPNPFEEVKNHIKEILQVGAIRCSNNPWASAVVLVRKKD